jgi:hypothetical protein
LRGAIYGMLVSAVGYTGTLLLSFTRFIKPRASCVPVN